MVAVEPALERLMASVLAIEDDSSCPSFCSEPHWRRIKPRALFLVGFQARHPELRTMEAFDTAMAKLRDALPPCRKCLCFDDGE
jgi:hypothetical protein